MNIFNPASSFLKRLRSGAPANIDPVRDWLAMLIFSTIVLVSIIMWHVWLFGTVASGGDINVSTPKVSPIFSRTSLDAIFKIFENRATEETKHMTGVYRYSDPSQ